MKIELPREPKELRSFVFTELNLVELNSIEVDRLLPHTYESAIKGGRHAPALKDASADAYETTYLPKLLRRDDVVGFDSPEARDVIDAWLRSSVVAFGRSGLSQRADKMDFIRARTIAAYRAGFPDRRRSRQADTVIYAQMLEEVKRRKEQGVFPSQADARKTLSEIVKDSVGDGVKFSDPSWWAPEYDGHTEVDITTLLALLFLEGFEALPAVNEATAKKGPKSHEAHYRTHPAVPAAAAPLGSDVVSYLVSFRDSTPLQTAHHLTAILGFRLFQLPLRTSRAIHQLLEDHDLPLDMQRRDADNPLDQYIDFSGDVASDSRNLARTCVQRDLRLTHTGLRDRLVLKIVRRAAETSEVLAKDYEEWTGPQRFQYLAQLRDNAELEPYFKQDLQAVRRANEDSEDDDTLAFLQRIADPTRPALDRLTDALFEATKARARHAALSWFRDTGGLNRANGMLVGDSKRRETWAYAPGNDLVTALLGIVFTDDRGRDPRREMLLADVLTQFNSRFGLLIDRPPSEFDTVAARAAASDNLEAFKRRLKLLGVFDGLSDDFSAQVVRNPLLIGDAR
ncbi:hypothetical protein [Nocardia violaceofusca]|uniref:hypothetical protein n=1 Tax=Nocardia violaceofusca TaxID=941182 RepID=UPI0007A3BDDC|nr:hypothetical protein [Nocardia violaceofusca]